MFLKYWIILVSKLTFLTLVKNAFLNFRPDSTVAAFSSEKNSAVMRLFFKFKFYIFWLSFFFVSARVTKSDIFNPI